MMRRATGSIGALARPMAHPPCTWVRYIPHESCRGTDIANLRGGLSAAAAFERRGESDKTYRRANTGRVATPTEIEALMQLA